MLRLLVILVGSSAFHSVGLSLVMIKCQQVDDENENKENAGRNANVEVRGLFCIY